MERRTLVRAALACAAVIALLYFPTLQFGFTGFDDTSYVMRHEWVRQGLSWKGLIAAFSSDGGIYWHPLTWLSHMLDVSLSGFDAGAHHAQNILFHIGSAVLLLLIARRCGLPVWAALACALLWALHPLRVEAVAWVAGRKDTLSGFFWLLAVWLYARYAQSPGAARYLTMLLAAAAGYLAKPTLVTFPFFLLLFDWWPLRRPLRWNLAIEKLPLFLLSLAVSWATFLSQREAGALSMLRETTLWERLQNALSAYGWYLRKMFWPDTLAILYPYPAEISTITWLGSALALAAVSAGLWLLRRRLPSLLFGWLAFLGILVPMIGLVQAGPQPYADRFSYLASIPLTLGIAAAAAAAAGMVIPTRQRLLAASLGALALVSIAALTWRTHEQIATWKDGETAFAHAYAAVPENGLAAMNLGALLIARGAYAEALDPLKMAVRINPRSATSQYNLGLAHTHLEQLLEGERALRRATQLDPKRAEAWMALGIAQSRMRRLHQAIRSYLNALRVGLAPAQEAQVRNDLGVALIAEGRSTAAEEQFRLALARQPGYPRALLNLATYLHRRGQDEEALSLARQALRQNPQSPQAKSMVATLEKGLAARRPAVR